MTELTYEENMRRFVEGATLMINTPSGYSTSTIYGTELHIQEGRRFDLVRGQSSGVGPSSGYVFARVERATGDIYSQSGKTVRGSLFSPQSGLDAVSRNGVVV